MRLISGVILAVLLLFPSSSASADTGVLVGQSAIPYIKPGEDVQEFQSFEAAARRFEKHIFVGQDGLLYVNIQKGEEVGISEEWFQLFKTALETTNRQLEWGTLQQEDILLIDGTHNVFGRQVVPSLTIQSHVSCAGRSGVESTWMGPRMYLDDCKTHLLINGLAGGAALGWLCAELGITAIPCGALGAVAALGAATIAIIDETGGHHGIYIQYTWSYQLAWVWHQ